uniref:Endonuclease/exonuclease/phosphatase domain-containing protein n=1 Tax=Scylla olivacea TaxID=85551 RepID=A0A0P4VZ55_SCYOL
MSERVILVKIDAKPTGLNIIQVYAPTGDHSDDEVDAFYEQVDSAWGLCKPGEVTLVMGDLNAKVGEGRSGNVVGSFGLGERNERGDKWVEWCESWDQVIMNMFFRHHPRHLYTWRSPGDRVRNQIDYITVNKRFRNSLQQVKTYLGADCGVGCDHFPVVAEMRVKFKRMKKNKKMMKD